MLDSTAPHLRAREEESSKQIVLLQAQKSRNGIQSSHTHFLSALFDFWELACHAMPCMHNSIMANGCSLLLKLVNQFDAFVKYEGLDH